MIQASVIIPVYNGAATIEEAIHSCTAQTFPVYEIIVVDDASTDNTVGLLEQLQVPQLSIIRNTENKGPAFCRNLGIERARGNWLFFLDADDMFHPLKSAFINQAVIDNPRIRMIGHGFSVAGDKISIGNQLTAVSPLKYSWKSVLLRNPVVTPALCIAAPLDIRFSDDMRFAEDHDFILRNTEKTTLYYIDLPLCMLGRKPLSGGGISASRWRMRKGEMHMYRSFCSRRNTQWLLPFLLLFSCIKHLKNIFTGK